jgi:phosphatidylinositol glycan class C protein
MSSLHLLITFGTITFSVAAVNGMIKMDRFISTITFILLILGTSPILKTLTKDISDDTLYTWTGILFLAHLLFHDYQELFKKKYHLPDSFSVNAAIFGSLLLASRLSSNLDVFVIILVAIQLFGLGPLLRRKLLVSYSMDLL